MTKINSLAHFINQFKIGTSKKSLYFDAHVASRSLTLLHLFYELNLVRRYKKLSNSYYRIYPSYSRYRTRTRFLKTYFRSSHYLTLSIRILRIIHINTPYSYVILETNEGLMTHKKALERGISGRMVMRIH